MEKKANFFDNLKDMYNQNKEKRLKEKEKKEQELQKMRAERRASLKAEALKGIHYFYSTDTFCDSDGNTEDIVAFSAQYLDTEAGRFEGIEFELYGSGGSTFRVPKDSCFKTLFMLAYIIPWINKDKFTKICVKRYNAQHQGRLEDTFYNAEFTQDGYIESSWFEEPVPTVFDFISPDAISQLGEYEQSILKRVVDYWLNKNVISGLGVSEEEFNYYKRALSYVEKEINRLTDAADCTVSLSKNELAGQEGEKRVEYALKWLDKRYARIKQDTSQRIRIINKDFIDEAQEFDHIVVGPKGIFLIETKNLIGNIEIDKNGNWIREIGDETKGMANPLEQIRRHEKVIRSFISPDVPVTSLICLANDETIITGVENSRVCVVKADTLVEWIENCSVSRLLTDIEVENIVKAINSHLIK